MLFVPFLSYKGETQLESSAEMVCFVVQKGYQVGKASQAISLIPLFDDR